MISAYAYVENPIMTRCFLDSVISNSPKLFDVSVIYDVNKIDEFSQIIDEYENTGVNFISIKNSLKDTLVSIMDTSNNLCTFFSDRSIIYRGIDLTLENRILELFALDQDIFCFSLRLGENVTWCDRLKCDNKIFGFLQLGDIIKWCWKDRYEDFGFPFSTNGNIFRSKDIKKMIKKCSFNNLNELEGEFLKFDDIPKDKCLSFKESKVFLSLDNEEDFFYISNKVIEPSDIKSCEVRIVNKDEK